MNTCPRCRDQNRDIARFCSHCGLSLAVGVNGTQAPGTIRHPKPADAPVGFVPVENAANLYVAWESAQGGRVLIGTEGLSVRAFNAGYGLRNVVLTAAAEGRDRAHSFHVTVELAELRHGQEATFEIPSYEVHAPLRTVRVALVSAEFGPDDSSSAADRLPAE